MALRKKVDLLGFPVDLVDMRGALALAEEFLTSGEPHRIVTLNPEMIILSRRNQELKRALEGADAYLPETAGIAWALGIEKLPGIDFMNELLHLASRKGYSVYFLGSEPGIAEKAAESAVARYPGLKVAGTHHGYFGLEEESVLVEEISKANPDILLVGMGTVPQETFIHRHRSRLKPRIAMGVGGSFDVLSGKVNRAPESFRRAGFEWLYRLITQPQRLGRMASTLPHFAFYVLRDRLKEMRH